MVLKICLSFLKPMNMDVGGLPKHRSESHNWPLLAGLRGALALVVLATHVDEAGAHFNFLSPLTMFSASTAVVGFLIVSGYSICHSINSSLTGFYLRRITRIMPVFLTAYVLALVPCAVGVFLPGHNLYPVPSSLWNLALNMFPLQMTFIQPLNTNYPAWSLGVECAFYALAPLFYRSNRKVVWTLFLLSAIAHAISADLVGARGIATLGWAWLFGWIIYEERDNPITPKYGVAVACVVFGFNATQTGTLSFLTVAATVGILIFQNELSMSPRVAAWLSYAGELSYPLYLIHMPTISTIKSLAPATSFGPFYYFAAILAACVVYHAIDKPLRYRSKRLRLTPKSAPESVMALAQ